MSTALADDVADQATWNPDAVIYGQAAPAPPQTVHPGFDPFNAEVPEQEGGVIPPSPFASNSPFDPSIPSGREATTKPKRVVRHCEFRPDGTVYMPVAGGLVLSYDAMPEETKRKFALRWGAQDIMRAPDPAAKLNSILLGIIDRREKTAKAAGVSKTPGRKPADISLQAMAHTLVDMTTKHGTPITLDKAHEKVAAFNVEQRQRLKDNASAIYNYHRHVLSGGLAPDALDGLI